MATFLEKSDTFTDWMDKINKFHEEIQNGFGIPSQENKYDTTDGKYLQVGAFGLGKIETTTTDTLDVVGTRFDFVSADATSNFSLPKNFLGGSLVTIINNGQGFQIIQNDDDLNFRTVYNDIYEEWVSFKNILDNVQFGLTKESIKQEDYLVGVPSADLVPMVIDGGTLTDAMNAQAQALLNQIENLKLTTVPVTKETLVTNGNLTAVVDGSIDVPKADNCGSISDTMNAQAQALLNIIENKKEKPDKIDIIDNIADLLNYDKTNVGYVYVKSYLKGKGIGGGYFYFLPNIIKNDDVINFKSNILNGTWVRDVPNKKDYDLDWCGAYPNTTDNQTSYIQKILDIMPTWSNLNIGAGTYYVNTLKIKNIGTSIKGSNMLNTTFRFLQSTDCFKFMEACGFYNLRIWGTGVNVHDVLLLDEKGHNRADVDIELHNCYFSESAYALRIYGRGVVFQRCNCFNIRYAWLDLQFPPSADFQPGSADIMNVRQGMRGYIFRDNRNHYSPCAFVINTGWNSRNARGFLYANNHLEGASRIHIGAGIDIMITGNISYQRSSTYKYCEFNYVENVSIIGNSFTQYKDVDYPETKSSSLVTVANKIKGLNIVGNTFNGIGDSLVNLYCTEASSDINISNNNYFNCFTNANKSILELSTASYDKINVNEILTAPNDAFIPIRRASGIVTSNHRINVNAIGSNNVHNLSRALSLGTTAKQGIYVGNGDTQTIDVGYEPRNLKVWKQDSTMAYIPYGSSTMAKGVSITSTGFNATGIMNEADKIYMWEAT